MRKMWSTVSYCPIFPLISDNLIKNPCDNYKNNINDIIKHQLKKTVENIL